MKLVIAIVQGRDANPVIEQLVNHNYRVTRIASTGGFLRRGNVTLLVGAEEQHVQPILDVLRETCSPPGPNRHRATVFVVDASHFEQV